MPERIASVNLLPVPAGLAAGGGGDGRAARVLPARRRASRSRAGERVAILGAGPIGLMLCACVVDAGGTAEVVGGRPERRELVPLFGGEPGDGEGADVVIEAAGTEEAWQRALELVRPGGTAVFFGGRESRRRAARRRLPPPLRGADPARRLPPRTAPRPRGARLPRERRLSVGAARHAPRRARGRRGAPRRPAARLPQGRRRSVAVRRHPSHRHRARLGLAPDSSSRTRAASSRRASARARARRAAPRDRPRRSGSRATRRASPPAA